MAGIRGRFRTSQLARRVYTYGILFCSALWGCFELWNHVLAADGAPQHEIRAAANRKLLSSGVEIIPGFTGAKCGSNFYIKEVRASSTGVPLKEEEYHYKKSDWEDWTLTNNPLNPNTDRIVSPTNLQAYDPSAYAQWEADSGGIVYVIIAIYLFLGIAIICDGHFVDSLEMICSRYGLNLPPDVAGATFMAAGSSAPELATSFMGVFVAKSGVGLGTILGSAVFNILIIIGAVAILTCEPLKLDYRPVIRDNFFYAVSVVLLCALVLDEQANLVDTVVLLLWYSAYILFLAYNDFLMTAMFGEPEEEEEEEEVEMDDPAKLDDNPLTPTMGDTTADRDVYLEPEDPPADEPVEEPSEPTAEPAEEGGGTASEPEEPKGMGSGAGETPLSPPSNPNADTSLDGALDEDVAVEMDDKSKEHKKPLKDGEEEEEHKRRPSYSTGKWKQDDGEQPEEEEEEESTILDKILAVLSFPFEIIFNYTMPNCHLEVDEDEEEAWEEAYDQASKEEKKEMNKKAFDALTCGQKWFWATFFISLLHITWISYFMVEFMLKIGCLWGIPDVVMGLTFLAMGTSIPDALGSVSVAQDGEGDMAVSNAVGSNVFDICIGLGLPWFIKLAMEAGDDCNYIPIFEAGKDVIPSIIILLSIIVVLFAVFVVGKWTLYPQSGYVLFGAYGMFIVYQLLNTYVINKDQKSCTIADDKCC